MTGRRERAPGMVSRENREPDLESVPHETPRAPLTTTPVRNLTERWIQEKKQLEKVHFDPESFIDRMVQAAPNDLQNTIMRARCMNAQCRRLTACLVIHGSGEVRVLCERCQRAGYRVLTTPPGFFDVKPRPHIEDDPSESGETYDVIMRSREENQQ